jgi:hypothetical protein
MKRFWKYNILLSNVLMISFFLTLYVGFNRDDVQLISLSKYIPYISFLHLIISIFIAFIKIRSQNFWIVVFLVIMEL